MKILPILSFIAPVLIGGVVISRGLLVESYLQKIDRNPEQVIARRTIKEDLQKILELQKQSLMKLLPPAYDESLIYNDKGEIIGIKTPEPILASVNSVILPKLNTLTSPIGKVLFNNPLTKATPALAVGSVTPTPAPAQLTQSPSPIIVNPEPTPPLSEQDIISTPIPKKPRITPAQVKVKFTPKQVVKKSNPHLTPAPSKTVVAQAGAVTVQVTEHPKAIEPSKEERKENKEEKREKKEEKKDKKDKD